MVTKFTVKIKTSWKQSPTTRWEKGYKNETRIFSQHSHLRQGDRKQRANSCLFSNEGKQRHNLVFSHFYILLLKRWSVLNCFKKKLSCIRLTKNNFSFVCKRGQHTLLILQQTILKQSRCLRFDAPHMMSPPRQRISNHYNVYAEDERSIREGSWMLPFTFLLHITF